MALNVGFELLDAIVFAQGEFFDLELEALVVHAELAVGSGETFELRVEADFGGKDGDCSVVLKDLELHAKGGV